MYGSARGKMGIGTIRLAAVLAATAWAGSAAAQTAEEIVAGHIKALGGKDAIAKVKSISRKADMSMGGAFGDMAGTVESHVILGKKAYTTVDLGGFMQTSGFDGSIAWENGMQGLRELTGDEAMQIRGATAITPLVGYKASGSTIKKLDDEKIGEADHYVIELSPSEGPKLKIYLDQSTKLLTKFEVTMNNPQFGEMTIVQEVAEYAVFEGLKLPVKETATIGDMFNIETIYTETTINGEVDEKIFEKPGS